MISYQIGNIRYQVKTWNFPAGEVGVKIQPLPDRSDTLGLQLFWERNFYPDVQMIANNLHAKGLIEAGDYVIDIDW